MPLEQLAPVIDPNTRCVAAIVINTIVDGKPTAFIEPCLRGTYAECNAAARVIDKLMTYVAAGYAAIHTNKQIDDVAFVVVKEDVFDDTLAGKNDPVKQPTHIHTTKQ